MPQSSANSDELNWHRRTAMDGNNRAWELSVRVRTPAEDREMLIAAHASAYHWAKVGTELNRMRATMLLAEVNAALGHGETALALAEEMRTYFLGRPETPDWELAFTHAIHAHCAHAAGRLPEHRESYGKAAAALAAIADEEDRKIVAASFAQVAAPATAD
jgi:hypothetical protein